MILTPNNSAPYKLRTTDYLALHWDGISASILPQYKRTKEGSPVGGVQRFSLLIPTKDGFTLTVRPGHWVTESPDGTLNAWTDEAFKNAFIQK